MKQKQKPIAVAIVNTNPDLVRMLRLHLEAAGFVVFEIYVEEMKLGETSVHSLLEEHDPKVIVYDVAPPYDNNWRFLDHLRANTGFKGRRFVITSTNVDRVREVVGNDEAVYEVVGKEDDILAVVRAVKEASRQRPTR